MFPIHSRPDADADEAGHPIDVDGPDERLAQPLRDQGDVVVLAQVS